MPDPGFGPDLPPDISPENTPATSGTTDPGGGNNNGGGYPVLMVAGPLVIRAMDAGADGVIDRFVGDVFTVAAFLETEAGQPAPTDGTITATITRLDEVLAEDIEVTVCYGNLVTFIVPEAATSVATKRWPLRATIRRNNGASDIQTFGPLLIRINAL